MNGSSARYVHSRHPELDNVEHYSKLQRLLRVTAWRMTFLSNVRQAEVTPLIQRQNNGREYCTKYLYAIGTSHARMNSLTGQVLLTPQKYDRHYPFLS